MISKVYGYLAAAGAAIIGVIAIFLTGRKAGENAVNLDNAEYQKESLDKAYKALHEADKQSKEVEDVAIEKANHDDFSGFNNKL